MENSDKLLRLGDVLELVPVASSTWRKWVADGIAPAKEKRGGSTFWKASEVQAFINGEWKPENSRGNNGGNTGYATQ